MLARMFALHVVSRALDRKVCLCMARVLATVKVFLSGPEVELQAVADEIARNLPEGFEFHGSKSEPLAFGMEVLVVGVSMPDEEGYSSRLEDYLRKVSGVDEISVLTVQRV